jgi:hypothetical protein
MKILAYRKYNPARLFNRGFSSTGIEKEFLMYFTCQVLAMRLIIVKYTQKPQEFRNTSKSSYFSSINKVSLITLTTQIKAVKKQKR